MAERDLHALTLPGAIHLPLKIAPVSHEVARGHFIQTTAYNGDIGGILRLLEGRAITVDIQNSTAQEEYVHFHGFDTPAEFDGTCEEGSLPILARKSIRYELPPQTAGSYYVHSHSMAHHGMEGGMYGGQFQFVLVEPSNHAGRYDREIFVTTHEWEPYMVNEQQEQRQLEESFHLRQDPEEAEEEGEGGWDIRYRLGSINGKALGHGEPIRVKTGERVLFHLLNASATENIQLAFSAHTFLVLAMDASPVPIPQHVAVLSLGVGERIDAIVEMNAPGIWVLGSTDEETRTNGMGIVVEYAGRSGDPAWSDVEESWDYTRFARQTAAPEGEPISLELHRLPLTAEGGEQWAITDADGKAVSHPVRLQCDQNYRIQLRNQTNEWHPMHLHRHTFELIRYGRRASSGLLKDTIVVPPYDSVELSFTPARTGLAFFHCHNQMHMGTGLQAMFQVVS